MKKCTKCGIRAQAYRIHCSEGSDIGLCKTCLDVAEKVHDVINPAYTQGDKLFSARVWSYDHIIAVLNSILTS